MTGGSVGSAMAGGLGGVTGLPWALAIRGVLPLLGMTALTPILKCLSGVLTTRRA